MVKVFRIIAYLNAIRYPVNLFGQALKFMTDLFVSVERLDEFFHLPIETADSEAGLSMLRRSAEVGPDSRQPDLEASVGYSHISGDLVDYGEVVLSDASFSWDFSNLLTAEKDCNGGFTGAEGHSAVAEGDMDGVLVPVDISAEVEMISLTTGRTFELYGLTIRTEPGELIAVIGSTGARATLKTLVYLIWVTGRRWQELISIWTSGRHAVLKWKMRR